MSAAKSSAKKILDRLKNARTQLESLLKDRSWIEEAKKVAEKQGYEVKKMLDTDVAKLRTFLEKERKELENLQKQIPGEVKKMKKFVDGQKKELTKLLSSVKAKSKKKGTPTTTQAGAAKKKVAKKKPVRASVVK